MRKLVPALVMAVALLLAGSARASYVCGYAYVPNSGSTGSTGYVSATFFTGAHCTGSFVTSALFCSTGATTSSCAIAATCGGTSYLYSEMGLHALVDTLQQSEMFGHTASPGLCGSGSAATWVSFGD